MKGEFPFMKFKCSTIRSIAIILVCVLIVNTTGCSSSSTAEEPNYVEVTEQLTPEPATPTAISSPIPTETSSYSVVDKEDNTPTPSHTPEPTQVSEDSSKDEDSNQEEIRKYFEELDYKTFFDENKATVTPADSSENIVTSVPSLEITQSPYTYESGDIYINSTVTTVSDQPYTYCGKTGLYTGEWRGDRPEGNGRFTISNDEYYDGEWDCGYIYGNAVIMKPWEGHDTILYKGQCSIDTVVGTGLIAFFPEKDKNGFFAIVGDFSDESSLNYYSIDDKYFYDDIGYIHDGEIISILDNLDQIKYETEVCLSEIERSYFVVENDYLYEPAASSTVVKGKYYGKTNSEGKPDGRGVFVLSNKKRENYPIMVNGVQKDVDWRDCELFLGIWSNGVLTGNYIYEQRSIPVDDQYFDYEHTTFKQYVYKEDDKLEKTMTYVDTFITNVETREITDTLKVIEVDYSDMVAYDDGMSLYRGDDEAYRGDRVEWQYYFRHDLARWDGLYTKGMYTKSEVYKTQYRIVPRNHVNSTYYDGYRAFYNDKGELVKYNEYNWMHPEGNTVPKKSHLSLGELILGGAVIFLGGYALYKLISTSSKGKNTDTSEKYLQERRTEIQKDVQSYNERLKKYEELTREADELEDFISSATYLPESDIYYYKQKIKQLRSEASRIKPSIF